MLKARYLLLQLLSASCLLATCRAALSDIIDTAEPIIRTVSEQDQYAYFGYSVVLHQTVADPTGMQQALGNSWIVVSAPNGTAMGGAVDNVGVLYRCPVGQGSCTPLLGDGTGADTRLYDTAGNGNTEDKSGQFMGGTLASSGDRFVACAHRYVRRTPNANPVGAYPLGRCVYSDRTLSGFSNYEPCNNVGELATFSVGVCQAGTSVAIADDPNSDEPAMAVGGPGVFNWRGITIRRSGSGQTRYDLSDSGSAVFGYQSYAMTTGQFLSSTRRDFAVSVPRRNFYRGTVNLVMNTNALTVVTQPELAGSQMGEYYGFSLVAANLNLDDRDELLVGAPMFRADGTSPETGRVFIYVNVGGNLQQSSILVGFEAYSRFGYAMANLGDITGDNRDDIAISAPFGSLGGTVYIYHSSSSQLLNPVPQQVITGSVLSTSFPGIASLSGFGTSLSSGVDVDDNTQMDLAIGAFESQHVILLRTRPLAQVTTSITSDSLIVNVEERFCSFGSPSELYACFNVTACATYRGDGLRSTLDLTYSLFADRGNIPERRIFFSNSQDTISTTENAAINAMNCFEFTAFVTQTISDRFNAFKIELEVTVPTSPIPTRDGNPDPINLSDFPVVSASGVSQLQVETFKDCNGDTCVPNLVITVDDPRYITATGTTDALTVGSVTSVGIDVNVLNMLDDAFQAVLTFAIPTNSLELDRVRNVTGTTQLSITCDSIPIVEEASGTEYTQYTCIIGNPISDGRMLDISIVLRPRTGLSGSAADIALNFSVSSVNPEDPPTIDDGSNWEVVSLQVNAVAVAYLDNPGNVEPREVFYASQAPDFEGAPQNVSQLGVNVITSFVVRNSGPSTIPEVELTVWWPLNSTESVADERTGTFLLYPAQFTSTSSATVTCETTYINPEGSDNTYLLPSDDDFETESQGGTGSTGGKRRRRKRRSLHARKFAKRQEGNVNEEEATMVQARDIMQTCLSDPGTLNCVPIRCTILQLRGGDSAQVDISSYVDDRFFAGQVDRYFISPTATVAIVNGDFIDAPNDGQGDSRADTATANMRVFPADAIIVNRNAPVPAWVIVVAIIAALIVIAVIAGAMWGLGFFRRKKHEELKKQKEDLQNLNDFGSSQENIIKPE